MDRTQTPTAEALADHVPRTIRAEMARRGISQEALGRMIGWDQRRVSRRLTGDVAMDLNEIGLIADALNVPLATLLAAPDGDST